MKGIIVNYIVEGWAKSANKDHYIKLVVSVKDKDFAASEALTRTMNALGVVGAKWKRQPLVRELGGLS